MMDRVRCSKFLPILAMFGLVLTTVLSTPLLGQSAEAARRGYSGPPNLPDSRVGTLSITWDYAAGQSCIAYAALTGWDANTTYTVEYAYTTPIRPVSGSQRLTTNANGAASGWMGVFGRMFLMTFSVDGVIVSGFPDC